MLHRPIMGTWGPNLIDKVKLHAWFCVFRVTFRLDVSRSLRLQVLKRQGYFRKETGGEIGGEQLKLWEELSVVSAASLKYDDSSLGRWDVCQAVDCGFWDISFLWEHVRKCVWSSFRTLFFFFFFFSPLFLGEDSLQSFISRCWVRSQPRLFPENCSEWPLILLMGRESWR